MALSFGEEPEPWMNRPSYNRRSSRKRMKQERNRKLRRIGKSRNTDLRSLLKKYVGYEW